MISTSLSALSFSASLTHSVTIPGRDLSLVVGCAVVVGAAAKSTVMKNSFNNVCIVITVVFGM